MPTMIFSNESRYWRGLCVNTLFAESSVPAPGNCEICIRPVDVPEVGCGGTATWEWTVSGGIGFPPSPIVEGWTLIENNCTGSGTPVEPSFSGPSGSPATTDCDCP